MEFKIPDFQSYELTGYTADKFLDEILDPKRLIGYNTPYSDLNKAGGIKTRNFIVLAAEQGIGKSLFALRLVLHQAKEGVKCVYFDIENGEHVTVERMVRINMQLDKETFLGLTKDELASHIRDIKNIDYYKPQSIFNLASRDKKTYVDVVMQAINDKAVQGYKIFVIDPFSRLCEVTENNGIKEEGDVAGKLSDLAQKLDIAIIAVHHLRKGNRNKYGNKPDDVETETGFVVPTLESLRGNSKIVDRASDVWGIIRFNRNPLVDNRGLFRILKNRTGLVTDFKIVFDHETLTFNQENKYDLKDFTSYMDEEYGKDTKSSEVNLPF